MPATIQRIHGLNIISAPGMPAVVSTAEDARIASLPGLVHFLEPERLSGSPLRGVDRAMVGHPVQAWSPTVTRAASADYGGRSVFSFPFGTSPIAYKVGSCPRSFTLIICCDLSASRMPPTAATANLFGIHNPGVDGAARLKSSFRWSVGSLTYGFEDVANASGYNSVPTGQTPAGNAPTVWVISYDANTRTSRIGRDNAAVLATRVHTGTPDPHDAADQMLIGGIYANSSLSWVGRIGRALMLDRNYHDPLYVGLLAREIAAMRNYYALA